MSSIAFHKVKKGSKQAVGKTVQQFAQEPSEMLKKAKTQINAEKDETSSPVVDEILQPLKAQEPSKEEEEQLLAKSKRRTEELENELLKLKRERQESEQRWIQEQDEIMKEDEQLEAKPLIEPTSKPKVGLAGAAAGNRKKKQGTREIAKGPSG